MARKGIYKRGNVWWLMYVTETGKVIRRTSGTTDYREAESMLIASQKAVRDGKHCDTVKITNSTLHELKDKYLEWMRGQHKSADTKEYRIDDIVSHFGDIPLKRFNTQMVEQYQTKLKTRKLKDSSVNKNVSILKAMIKKAVDWEMTAEETLKRVRKAKNFKEPKGRVRFLSLEEAKNLVSVCDGHLQPLVITALNTGMRRGEIFNLTWDNVDLQHGFITLTDTKNGEGREIPINETMRATLNKLPRHFVDVPMKGKDGKIQTDEDGKVLTTKELVPYLFHDPKTLKPYTHVKRSFATALKNAGITKFRFHDLRHTFASQLVMAGVDLTAVKELLGHKDIKMTLRYAHLAPAHKRNAVNVLDSLLKASPPRPPDSYFTITSQSQEKESALSANSLI